jgi:hypothetical protein
VTHDAFIHVPHLHGRLTPADKSALRITREALAIYDERARKAIRTKKSKSPGAASFPIGRNQAIFGSTATGR